jgi:hypothetical protein
VKGRAIDEICALLRLNPMTARSRLRNGRRELMRRLLRILLQRSHACDVGYFRFINVAFDNEVCRRIRALITTMRAVKLHGDVHLEQYAVTDAGVASTTYRFQV